MAGESAFLTPKTTPVSSQSVETSTPWSDVLLEELRTAIELNPPPGIIKRCGFATQKTRKRRPRIKALWLSVLVLVWIWWAMRGSVVIQGTDSEKGSDILDLARLKFIDANHPNIRVC